MSPASIDGVVLLGASAAGLALIARRQLRDEPRWVGATLVGIVLLGIGLRLALSLNAPMNAWAYSRVLWLSDAIARGFVFPAFAPPEGVALVDLFSYTNLAAAALTPLAYFVHARYLFGQRESALAAALMIAVLPHHIRFSASDVQFIVSLLSSSLTFIAIYAALIERDRLFAYPAIVLAPLLALGTYYTRPENILFVVVDLAALLLYARNAVSRQRLVLVAGLTLAAGGLAFYHHILPKFGGTLHGAVGTQTLIWAFQIATSPRENTLINPSMMPTVVPVLAAAGAWLLLRQRAWLKLVLLGGWLGAFFVAESSVRPPSLAMMARYHLHLVTPFVLFAAAAAPALFAARRRWMVAAALAWLIAAPWLHKSFIQDVGYSEMREFAFLRTVTDQIQPHCEVVEFTPEVATSSRPTSKWRRLGTRATAGGLDETIVVVPMSEADATGTESVTTTALTRLSDPAACTYVYLGLTCVGSRDPEREAESPVCTTMRATLAANPRAALVASHDTTARYYDDPHSGRIVMEASGHTRVQRTIQDGDPLRFELWLVR